MKKIILFLLLLISFSVFSQNPDRFRNGIRTQFVQPDTLSTANRDALTPKLGTIIFHKDTGFSRWEQWDGSDWVALGIAHDVVPTDGSTNGVESNGVFDALALKADESEVFKKDGSVSATSSFNMNGYALQSVVGLYANDATSLVGSNTTPFFRVFTKYLELQAANPATIDWRIASNSSNNGIRFEIEDSAGSNSFTGNFYSLNVTGAPLIATDLTDKLYVDGAISGATVPVINTLTSTSTTSALSAAQGKVLKDSLDLKAGLTSNNTFTGNNIFSNGPMIIGGDALDYDMRINNGEIIMKHRSQTDSQNGAGTIGFDLSGNFKILNGSNVGTSTSGYLLISPNNLTTVRTISFQDKSGTVALIDDLPSGSGGGYSGNYKFTTKSGNETLDSTIVKSATSGRFDKMWRTYTANDTITVPGNLPVGWSSVIEAGSATDSILIKADTGVDIYGQGNSFVQSGTGIDGLWLKKGRTVALIYKGANSVRAEGPWNVATITPPVPTNYWPTGNAASPTPDEANAVVTFTSGEVGVTSESGGSNGSYTLKFRTLSTGTTKNGYLTITGLTNGVNYKLDFDARNISGDAPNIFGSTGTTGTTTANISGASFSPYNITFTTTSTTVQILVYINGGISVPSGSYIEFDNARLTVVP